MHSTSRQPAALHCIALPLHCHCIALHCIAALLMLKVQRHRLLSITALHASSSSSSRSIHPAHRPQWLARHHHDLQRVTLKAAHTEGGGAAGGQPCGQRALEQLRDSSVELLAAQRLPVLVHSERLGVGELRRWAAAVQCCEMCSQ